MENTDSKEGERKAEGGRMKGKKEGRKTRR
jgi:hypothetical protein